MNLNKKTSMTVAALTITAILLGVILLSSQNQTAQAAMLNSQTDFELLTAGTVGADDALFILDKNAQKMVIYTLSNNNKLNLIGGSAFPFTKK